MNISQAVIRRIEELCRERNLTINALSNISGVTQSTVNDIISGKTYTQE
jgi:Helix-turn-helix.